MCSTQQSRPAQPAVQQYARFFLPAHCSNKAGQQTIFCV